MKSPVPPCGAGFRVSGHEEEAVLEAGFAPAQMEGDNYMIKTRTYLRAAAALPFAVAVFCLGAPLAFSDDLPSLIDERDPTRAGGLREAVDVPRDEPGAEVMLPDT